MRVGFRTPRAAPTGYRYFAFWQTLTPRSLLPDGCSPSSNIDVVGVRGGANKLVVVLLKPEFIFGDAFCPGPSDVAVFLQRANRSGRVADSATKRTYRQVAKLRFRVFRPV